RFAGHHRLRAGAPDPARHAAVRPDQRLRAGLRRGGPLAPYHRGERKGLATSPELGGQGEQVFRHARALERSGRPAWAAAGTSCSDWGGAAPLLPQAPPPPLSVASPLSI